MSSPTATSTAWQPFGDGWTVAREGSEPVAVELPHDAMISEQRSADAPNGYHGGFFPGGRYVYRKRWAAPDLASGERVLLRFEAVARRSVVRVNGTLVGGSTSAYREFEVDVTEVLRGGQDNDLEVVADTTDQPSSRWYVGSGIHRPVSIRRHGPVAIGSNGVRVRTRSLGDPAQVEVQVEFTNPDRAAVTARVELIDGTTTVAQGHATTDATTVEFHLAVPGARLWSAEDPHLYTCLTTLQTEGAALDVREERVGIRTVALDSERGFLINDSPVMLRGGNIHHDNGVIGSISLPAAERRRARILKAQGFNAVRSAHNPLSRSMLRACDEVGLYVMDETTDVWWTPKTDHDDADTFLEHWKADLQAMVLRDRNHPSVVMLSISNENGETASLAGLALAQSMKALVNELDGTRPVTAGVNLTLNAFGRRDATPPARSDGEKKGRSANHALDSTAFNTAMHFLGPIMTAISATPLADRGTRGIFDVLDVAGYNYGAVRFRRDAKAYPSRFILGTEDMPGSITSIWPAVEELPNVIGDFLWAGWDYLGEAGVGHWVHGKRIAPMMKSYPYLTSGSGVIDITGCPTAGALLAQAVWRTSNAPAIAVRPLDVSAGPVAKAAWRASDAISSWSWAGREGQQAEVEVYSSAPEVELQLNGRSLGRCKAGRENGSVAKFRVPYGPGELLAIAHGADGSLATSTLTSAAGPLRLTLRSERTEHVADGNDLAYLWVEVTDANGVVESLADDTVTLTIDGPAELAGFGSGAPATEESFADLHHRTYYGRALIVLRTTRTAGRVQVTATSPRHGSATHHLDISAPESHH